MSGPADAEATRREFDEVMRRTRFATIEQVAADLRQLPAPPSGPDSGRAATRRDTSVTTGGAPDLPSRAPARTR